uniref:Biogenesis of lysosome-related organelles complex 1 subunit 5 n=1 Tax=Monodelphis domestica TaxID=13616 RepID=A0A5F8G7E6_MONDO
SSGGGTRGTRASWGDGRQETDLQGPASSAVHLIIKDLGEIHSRLLEHLPIIQGETLFFVKVFEEK